MYLKLMKCLFKAYHDSNALDQFVNKLVDVSLLHFNNNYADDNLPRKYCAVTCLAWITEIIENWDLEKWKSSRNKIMAFVTHQFANNVFNHTLTKSKKENTSAIYLGQRGRIISEYYNCVWTCLAFHTSRCANSLAVVPLIEFALYTLEIGTDVVPAVCRCIEPMLAQILIENEERLLAKLLHCVWNMAFERRKSEIFWIAIESFMDLVFHQCLLDHSDASILIHFCEKAHALSDYCPTIFHMFVFRCLGVWIRSKSARRQICSHAQFIAHALTFGPVHRKDQRANGDADAFVFSLGETCSVNSLIQSEHLDQVSVRAAAVSLIISLDSGHPLVCELITLLLAEDARIGATRSRYYANSLIHLKKNRVWQAILVLEPLCAQETLTGVLNNVYSQLIEEGSQLSIRLMHEWLAAARIRVGSIGSFLGIIYHVGKLLDSAHQQQFILASFNCILPWCMAQNFNTRVTAQVSFHKLWLICEANSLQTALDLYAPVESSLRMSYRIGIGNSARCTQKILDNYYFKIFDAYKHYSLQTIFYDILRLTSVSDYEWIPSHVFTKFYNENTFLPIYNNDDELTEFEIDSIKVTDDEIEGETVENGNVQKKMTPCKRSADNNDSLSGELIVVASLIDKIPNLGGKKMKE
uniref:Uncharacterized protein n=1 Tax=Strigamia maritima TaxID=126957 RepID=T1IWW2_STRMM